MANASCGVNSAQLAYLMKDLLGVDSAMQMDQGGSTVRTHSQLSVRLDCRGVSLRGWLWLQTMWVKGQPGDGVVSANEWAPRRVYSALFVAYDDPNEQP